VVELRGWQGQIGEDTGVQLPEQIMSRYEKILIVLLLGSLWGALELFGRDLLRATGMPQKSALLFGLGIIILYASKRLVDFPGSVVVMALIAGLFKTASSNFFPCQFAAVMINGIVFDVAYSTFKGRLDHSPTYRTIAAPVIVYASYAIFALVATFVLREGSWASAGWAGIRSFLLSDAVSASLISIVTIHLGYYLGNAIQPYALLSKLRMPAITFRIVSVVLVAAIWIAGQTY
jgi:membrane protein DedA with SNARE-associated domain